MHISLSFCVDFDFGTGEHLLGKDRYSQGKNSKGGDYAK
jgi:hypothetical protein